MGQWTSQLAEYLAGHSEVLAAYLYGSHAEGRANALSDMDIGVLIRDGLAEERLWRLEDALAADLRRILHTDQVDLVVLNLAPLRIRYEVITKGKVLYSDRCFLTRIKEAMDETERRQYQDTFAKVRAVHRRVKEAADAQF
jgi:predicted nucleotidyltransferase